MNEVVGEAFAWRQDERGKIEMTWICEEKMYEFCSKKVREMDYSG